MANERTVVLTDAAYRTLCGLVQDNDVVENEAVFADVGVWLELREAFPLIDYYGPRTLDEEEPDG